MIRRNPLSAGTNHSEPLYQASFTAMKGVDSSKAVTVPNVVDIAENLNVNSDGSMSLRKPLIIKRAYKAMYGAVEFKATAVHRLYDGKHTLVCYTNANETVHLIDVLNTIDGTSVPVKFVFEQYSNSEGIQIDLPKSGNITEITDVLDLSSSEFVNMSTSTLCSVRVNATNTRLTSIMFDADVLDYEYAKSLPRYAQITKSDGVFTILVKNPEMNTITTDTVRANDFNLTLDNAYSTRDVYNSNYAAIVGIQPYVYCASKDTPSKIDATYTEPSEHEDECVLSTPVRSRSMWDGALPPYNPLMIEPQIMLIQDSPATYYFNNNCGRIRISFNKFTLNGTPTVCSKRPYEVTVSIGWHEVDEDFENFIKYKVDGPGYKGDYVESYIGNRHDKTYIFSYADILGNASDGYYVVCDSAPVIAHLIGFPDGNVDTYSEYRLRTTANTLGTNAGVDTYRYTVWVENYDGDVKGTTSFQITKPTSSNVYSVRGNGVFGITIDTIVTYKSELGEDSDMLTYRDSKEFTLFDTCFKNRDYNYNPDMLGITGGPFCPARHSIFRENYLTLLYRDPEDTGWVIRANGTLQSVVSEATLHSESVKLNVSATFQEHVKSIKTISEGSTSTGNVSMKVSSGQFEYSATTSLKVAPTPTKVPPYATLSFNAAFTRDSGFEDTYYNVSKSDVQLLNVYTADTDLPSNIQFLGVNVESDLVIHALEYPKLYMYNVSEITEKVQYPKFTMGNSLGAIENATVLLKAFTNFISKDNLEYYGVWEYTLDGVNWMPYYNISFKDYVNQDFLGTMRRILFEKQTTSNEGTVDTYYTVGVLINAESSKDNVFLPCYMEGDDGPIKPYEHPPGEDDRIDYVLPNRADVIVLQNLDEENAAIYCITPDVPIGSVQFRYTLCTVKEYTLEGESEGEDPERVPHHPSLKVDRILAQASIVPLIDGTWSFGDMDLGNATVGDKLYYNSHVYSYNHESFKNHVLCSDAGVLITPYSNTIDVNTVSDSVVTTLVPWRNYLIAATNDSVHLINQTSEGAFVKTVCTYVGIPTKYRRTCKAILNGVVFMSGTKFYTLYPSTTSGDESILNLNEISHPINHILDSLDLDDTPYDIFSMSTERKYYTFIPYDTYTYSVVYDYDLKVWYSNKYDGVRFTDYSIDNLNAITMYGVCDGVLTEYYFEKNLKDVYPNFINDWGIESFSSVPHGDFLTIESITPPAEGGFPNPESIHFILDSGQRTDNISLTRKFVESKFLLATLNSKAAANLTVDVYIDGNPYKTRLKGDGIVFKEIPDDVITLGDESTSDGSDVYNAISQAYLRYSGKGKTIRHVIEGKSLYNFKLYEVFYRYRPMPNKQ